MKLKGLLKKTGAVFMASAMLCTGAAAVLPIAAESGIEVSAAAYGDYEYKVLSNGTVEITWYNGSASSLSIPGSINGKKVTSIGASAFRDCTSLTSIKIPSSVTSIESRAFLGCTSLTSVTIPSSVKSIGEYAFNGCKGLADKNGFVFVNGILFDYFGNSANVIIPSDVTSIGGAAFEACTSLTSIKIPSSVTSIGEGAFAECTSLKSVTIPSSVKSIGEYAFYLCTSLKSVTIPSGVSSIGERAFWSCTSLTNVTILSGVTSIGKYAFSNCESLTSITIPSGVSSIGYMAFSDCESLTSVTIPSSVKSIDENALGYYMDENSFEPLKLAGFTISGTKGTAAEKYAKDNGFKFVELPAPGSLSLNKTSMSLGMGESIKLTANVLPDKTPNKIVSWRTSSSKILTVDQNGNVKAVGTGIAWITARTTNGKEKSCKITVKNAPTKVTLTKGILTIGVGEKYSVNSGVNNGAAAAKRTYRTSNSSIVKMTRTDWQGDFVGVKPGVAYVTVRTYNGKESTCKVTVKAAPTSVTISKKSMTMKVGQTATLSCSVPSNAGCATRTFRTSNSSVVKMTKTNWTGSFKAMKPGTAYVTVRTYNGKESTCKITVK